MTNPICDDCIESKDKIVIKKATNFFEELEKDLRNDSY